MEFSSPKAITWWVAVVIGVIGLLATFITIPFLSGIAFWLVFIAFLILAVATVTKGL